MIVGLTGGIGSGKTTVAKMFAEKENVIIYIADLEAKKLMNSSKTIKTKLIEAFGENTYQNNQLNRQFIANIVFNNKSKLAILNSIVHPEVKLHFKNFVQKHQNKTYIIYENAILFESKADKMCDFIISVYVPLEERILRIQKRDNATKSEILARINSQFKEEKKLLQSNYLIENILLEKNSKQVNNIHNILTQKTTLI
ncbi:dephospho-CoA kinase [Polaribacter aestuariivivens]|uniref:Dephospho-CoA kinase n=1 Tax=Polaribacter aestuariivivens TaxID=2304626 RepID=A0A5S3N6P3_9FLAO|nr:dephospho-CoA kinase [Polaribacter aestuariivivens]TMM30998.1 dephospho-CoA kinase [Polaribacter aestuariivivens]